jgi:hypothetical protein
MTQRDPKWLDRIMEDAARKVEGKPNWMRSPELQSEFRRIAERQQAQQPAAGTAKRDKKPAE